MSRTSELPEMVQEFVELSRAYLVQETVEPAKALGRYAGFSFAGAICFAFGALFLGIAGTRTIVGLMPDGHMIEPSVSVPTATTVRFFVVSFLAPYWPGMALPGTTRPGKVCMPIEPEARTFFEP